MKKYLVSCLMLGAFFMVLTGMPLQLVHIDTVKSAEAKHIKHNNGKAKGKDNGNKGDPSTPVSVPEPATLGLLSSGIAGLGIYAYGKRKNKK